MFPTHDELIHCRWPPHEPPQVYSRYSLGEVVATEREADLNALEIHDLPRRSLVLFVVASIGKSLRYVKIGEIVSLIESDPAPLPAWYPRRF
jgi:hypothetical protein